MGNDEKNSGEIAFEKRIFPATDESLPLLSSWIETALERAASDKKASMQMLVAAEEIFVNIARYAYSGESGEVTTELSVAGEKCILRFTDTGIPFNPLRQKDPDLSPEAQERAIGGLGIYMAKKMTDGMDYAFCGGKNILTLTKNFDRREKMEIKQINCGDKTEYALIGRLDTTTAPEADAIFDRAAEQGGDVVVDLAGLEYISSVGLRSFKRLHVALKKEGGNLYLRNTTPAVMEVFKMTGFVDLLNIL